MLVDHIAEARDRILLGIKKAEHPPIYRPDLDPCWLWLGSRNDQGYGKISFLGFADYAHRVAHIAFNGPIPNGYDVDHLCLVTACANPTHLEAVTHTVNLQRSAAAIRRGVPLATLRDMIEDLGSRPDDDLTPPDAATAEAGEWLSIPDAAALLHCHIRTVHRRISSGELPKRALLGGRTRVWVSQSMIREVAEEALADAEDDTPETPQDTVGQDLAVLDRHMALVDRVNQMVTEQVAPLLTVIDDRDATIREQAEEIGRLREVERELLAELERVATPDTEPAARAPWWQRLFGGQ